MILILLGDGPGYIEWQEEAGFTSWNVYEGDLDVLKGTGVYTQVPGSNPLADRRCGETVPWVEDFDMPPVGKTVFCSGDGAWRTGSRGACGGTAEGWRGRTGIRVRSAALADWVGCRAQVKHGYEPKA